MLATQPTATSARKMRRYATQTNVIEAEGVIQQVDPVGRELPVLVDGVPMHFYVPLHCTISLNDEPVKMRLLQPRDRARLEYSVQHGISTVHSITVQCCDGLLPRDSAAEWRDL